MSVYNFLVSGPNSPTFFRPIGDEMLLIKYFSDFRYVDPFRRYGRSKSKVVKNRAEFLDIFALPNFVGGTPCKIRCPLDHPGLEPRHLVKFREVTRTTPKVIDAPMWNLSPILNVSP